MRKILFIILSFILMFIATLWDRRIKDYKVIFIDNNDVLDADVILNPPQKYSELLNISADTRKQLSEHMRENNYKLKHGKQRFMSNNPTYRDLVVDGFKFETV